jgi:hypothetical protein
MREERDEELGENEQRDGGESREGRNGKWRRISGPCKR